MTQRYSYFKRKAIGDTHAEECAFTAEHYSEAGLGFTPMAGMPQLEAHQLVNGWNGGQHEPRFVYWLEV